MKREAMLMNAILAPVVSEKSTDIADKQRTAVFRVAPAATKADVRAAVEKLFEVKVAKVRTARMRGKAVARRGLPPGRRAAWKKAYVRLQEGHDINFSELQ